MEWYKNKKMWTFVGGMATAVIGSKVLKAPCTREACVKGIAVGMKLKNDAAATIQNISNDAREKAAAAEDNEGADE